MLHFFLVILFFFSIILIIAGVWMIIETVMSKDRSMGMGAFLGVVSILLGTVLFLISDAPKWDTKTNDGKNNTKSYNNKSTPLVPIGSK